MIKDRATSQENVETAQSNLAAAKADVEQAAANLTIAQINLGYTTVKAPFDGRMGRHLVDVGNLVGAGTPTTLATIEQIDPLYVYFTLNEIDVLRVRDAMRARGIEQAPVGKLPIYLGLQTEDGYPHQGTLDFVNSGLDTSTGVLQLRAQVDNKERYFVPGLFVRVRVPLGEPKPGLFVPDAVVGYDQAGHYVLVVGAGNKVERRTVVIGALQGKLREIAQGLKAEEKVVIDGVLKAVPGSVVTPSDGQIAAAAAPQQ
jgi:RND family efflux transporter MFP subunit